VISYIVNELFKYLTHLMLFYFSWLINFFPLPLAFPYVMSLHIS